MASSLSNIANNLSEGIHKIKCIYGHHDKKCETCGITYEICDCFLQYTNFQDYLIEYKCLYCKNYQPKSDEKLKEQFLNTSYILTMIIISLVYYCEKVFILLNI